ncbi:uncharacterized protein BX663DRAFT_501815 [Cokeromyces recurvatus]|uniref:uncharacterized protein n=1 Tax=Cokeromyces recurvatus TaxID=90255 RepID=UPI00221ECCD0|nr:uncharacterized protein BX663DRAFT_501815 [Cokeromyces recurvatus]KAI7905116.1 hypothetical protein BX663DRAFT_501815 [Cokeromyces recurvatus]
MSNEKADKSYLKRRKSDSNLLNNKKRNDTQSLSTQAQLNRQRITQTAHQLNKSISLMMTESQISQQVLKKDNNPQEDTFYRALEIKFHHSVGSMSISPACRDVVLAGRQGLVIIDLEDPWLIPRILPHVSKWEVADVQWSPHIVRESWVASTSNQKLLVWNLNYTGSRAIEHVFHAHTRAISDINWSPHQPDILATCSVDTYVHLWDLREPQTRSKDQDDDRKMRPTCSFTPWNAAATQVKFNRKSEHLLASAHDKEVKIWDLRKGAVPVTSITAHSKKIYGIDWSRQNDHDLVTCSLDKLVKFWNIHTPEVEEEVIVTDTPIWRARNTPFGNGVLIMPQRTDSKLSLYNRACPETPVYAFDGHQDTVKEFVWRWKGDIHGVNGDDREFQLVTWSKDQNLRLWPVSEDIMRSVGHDLSSKKTKLSTPATALDKSNNHRSHSFQQEPIEKSSNDIRSSFSSTTTPTTTSLRLTPSSNASSMAPYRSNIPNNTGYEQSNAYREQKYSAINPLLWMQNVKTVGPTGEIRRDAAAENNYQSVAEEMSTVLNKYLPVGVKTEKINAASRTCTISLHGPWSDTGDALLRITIRFSPQYPDNSPPKFDIHKNSMISIYYRAHMTQDLNALASSYTSHKKWCLEPCIRYLLGESMQDESEYGLENPNSSVDSSAGLMNQHNNSTGSPGYWKGTTTIETDSDDELGHGWRSMGEDFRFAKRESMTSERGIMVDMSIKQSTDAKVPFPRLCGGVFSGSGQLVCFFSTLRVRNTNKSKDSDNNKKEQQQQDNQSQSDRDNGEYFENTYSDFYRHPKTYEQFEEYKEIAAMSRQGKNATVLVGGTGGAFGEYAYDDEQDDIDDGLNTIDAFGAIYYKTDNIALNSSIGNGDNLLYHGTKTDRITHNVIIADFSDKMPYSPWLAREYILSPKDPVFACIHNAKVCKKYGRFDLYKVWLLVVEVLRECVPIRISGMNHMTTDGCQVLIDNIKSDTITMNEHWQRDQEIFNIKNLLHNSNIPIEFNKALDIDVGVVKSLQRIKWGMHPLGRKLVDALLQHFISIGDIQTATMLSCSFKIQSTKRPSSIYGQKSIPIDKRSETIELDYFSLKANHRNIVYGNQHSLRANSGPSIDTNEKITITSTSNSYGSKPNAISSYFWDNDTRKITPSEKNVEKSNDTPNESTSRNKRNLRLNKTWVTSPSKPKIPSNTAPGIRHVVENFGPYSPGLSSPIIGTPTTPLFNKEGRVLPDPSAIKIEFTNKEYFDSERFFEYNHIPLLDPKGAAQRDVLCFNYADLLYRWNLLDQRAEILQYLTYQPFPPNKEVTSTNIQVSCYVCGTELSMSDKYCMRCRKNRKLIRCCFCHILVKGLVNFCIHCGHGGHSNHMEDWFVKNQQTYCMTGCGCKCALEPLELII